LSNDKTIVTVSNDLIIDIPYGSLVDASNQIVQGEIKIEVKDFTEKKYNLLQSPNLIFNNQFVNSRELFYIAFSKNNEPLNTTKPISVYIKNEMADENQKLQILIGQNTYDNTLWYSENNPKFEISALKHNISTSTEGSLIRVFGYKIEINGKDNWYCLADKLDEVHLAQQQLIVTHNNNINQSNTIAYFISDNQNTVIKLDSNKNDLSFKLHYGALNQAVQGKIILITQISDENYQFGMTNVVLGKDEVINVKSASKNLKEIKTILSSL
jgi:hypothetical protein